MIIKMLETTKGSPNGINIYEYVKDEVYPKPNLPMPDDLGSAFVSMGVAEQVIDAPVQRTLEPPKKQADAVAPMTKDEEEKPDKPKKKRGRPKRADK